jgi:adenosylmethionine---8-amino-7-oxononanoate aminotransferase
MSGNIDWLERSRAALWHPCTQMKVHETLPIVPIARGEGAWLVDFDGRRYLDGVSSWWVNLFGHANPRINAALVTQLADLEHVMLAGFTHRPAVELAERLAALAPPGLGHAFFASDGASAVEIALKMSFHYWRNHGQSDKRRFLHLAGSYHGETLGALMVTDVSLFREAYGPLLMPQVTLPSPSEGDGTAHENAESAALALERWLIGHAGETAALIVEPLVQGAAGMRMYDAHYLRRAAALCIEYGVHLIADEIMTGFGRTGTLFACEQAPIRPDFLCLSKGITGGYLPLSAVLTTNDVYAAFYADDVGRGFLHSHSYTGNALACRAALTVLNIFADDDVIAENRLAAERREVLTARLAAHRRVENFRHCGTIDAFDVRSTRTDLARWFFAGGLAQGILLRPIGNTVYFMPPYIVTDAEFAMLVNAALTLLDRLDE